MYILEISPLSVIGVGNTFSMFVACIFFFKFYLFIYFWLRWVFVSVRGLSPVAASGGHSSLRCAGLSLSRPLLLRSTGSRRAGSVAVAHGPSCSAACGIFPDQGSNPCPLHWQADSQPLCHQGSPMACIFTLLTVSFWWTEVLNFNVVQFVIFSFMISAICVLIKKIFPYPKAIQIFFLFSFRIYCFGIHSQIFISHKIDFYGWRFVLFHERIQLT